MRTLLDPRQMVWMVVGDRAALEGPLREPGIGEIVATEA